MATPAEQYHHRQSRGVYPPLGSMGAMLDNMPPTLRYRLLAKIEPQDRALSDTVARLLERVLSDPRR